MQNLSKWLKYIESQIGFILPETQLRWLDNAVRLTAKKFGLTIEELWLVIQKDEIKRRALLDAVLIIGSRFFRHKPSMDFVIAQALLSQENQDIAAQYSGEQQQETATDKVFKVWSVGCSEGQETWSLAMNLDLYGIKNFSLLGTDLNSVAIETARKAVYADNELSGISSEYQHYVQKKSSPLDLILNNNSETWSVSEVIHDKVTFGLKNVFLNSNSYINEDNLEQVLEENSFDVIFCQNMLIYFRQFDQRDILSRLAKLCKVGGHIVLAPNEAYFWKPSNLRRVDNSEVNVWQKLHNE